MAKDDYFVVAYRILVYLYACVKSGVKPAEEVLSPEKLDITPQYWLYVMEHLQSDGYITDIYFGRLLGGIPTVKIHDLQITPKGIEFLQENSTMGKAKEFLKTLKEIIPGL